MNEFVIKNGFISKGNSIVSGSLSGETLNLTTTPSNDNSQTQVLVRNNTTGLVEYRDASTFSGASGSNTFVTGTTFGGNQAILTRNDGTEVFKLSGSSSVQLSNPSGNKIDIDVTIPAGMNTYVTGFTYNDNNTFTINDNAGSAFTATINQVSGLTVNGTLSATTLDGNTILSGGTNLLTIIEGLDTYVTGGTINLSATTNTNSATIGLLYKNSEGIPHTLPFDDTFTTGGTYDNGTALITFDKNDGSKYNVDLSTIDVNDTFVTGTTFGSNQAILTRNDGTEVFKLSGSSSVQLSNPSGNKIDIDVTIPAGMNTYVTGFTYNDNNTFTINDNAGSAFTATINQVSGLTTTNFIDYANTSDPSAVSGRTYYDVSENALSYFPETPNMDVTINIGQEGVTRVYNNTGIQINNGQACHLSGEFNGVATVKLAIASGTTDTSDTSYEVTGIATHNIPNGTTGFITNIGLVRDLNITGTTPGSAIFLSDQIPGKLVYELPTTNSSRISQIGYVIATGTTTGRILVELSNESVSVLSTKEIDVLTQNNASTGTRSGGFMTVNGGDNSKFDISAGSGTIMDNFTDANTPLLTEVVWDTITGVTLTSLTGSQGTYIFINSSGGTLQFPLQTPPQQSDKRDNIFLGIIGHASNTVINSVFNTPIQVVSPINQLEDLTSSIGPFSKNGNRVSNITGTLELQKSSGNSFVFGGNLSNNNKVPSNIESGVLSGSTLVYAKGTAVLGPSGTTVDVQNYDSNGLGTISSIPGANYVATRIWHAPVNNVLVFQYAQFSYSTQSLARDSFPNENYTSPPGLDVNAYLVAVLIYKKGDGDLDNALVIPQGKFAGTGGGGTSPDTLQSVYDNSIPNPEILTDATNGSVDFRVGSGSDSDNLIRFQQNDGTVNAFITGEGNSSFNNISGTTLQLNTVALNPTGTDILVRNSTTGVVDYRPVSGITPDLNTFVTGFTYNDANTFTISDNNGSAFTATINQVSGLTVNGILSATTYTGITLNSLDDVTTNIPATPDNSYQGRMMYFDVASNEWLTTEEYVSTGTVTIWGKKGSAGTIDKGLPVYIVGFDDDIHEVELANSSTGTTMPVIGFTSESFDNTNTNPIVTFGKLTGINTSSGTTTLNPNGETWVINDELYVSTTTGGLTKFRPTGSDTQIQRIAKILKVGTVDGQLFVFNTARTAGLPNLTTNYLWVGDGSDTPQETIKTSVGVTVTGFTYNDNNTFTIFDNDGGSFPSTINQVSGLTVNGILSATTLDGDTILSGGTNLLTIIESLDTNTFVSGGTYNDTTNNINFSGNSTETTFDVDLTDLVSSVSGDTFVVGGTYVDSTNTIALLRNDGNFVNVTGVTNTYVTGGTVSVPATDSSNDGTIGLFYKDSDGTPRTLPFKDTFVTGTTFASNQAILTRNNGTEVLKLTGGTNVTLSNPSTNQIKIGVDVTSFLSVVSVTGTTYSATTSDDVIGFDTSSVKPTLFLPDSTSSRTKRYEVKDIGVNSRSNPITIEAAGSDTIITTSVVSSFLLSSDGGAVILVSTGAGQWWQM